MRTFLLKTIYFLFFTIIGLFLLVFLTIRVVKGRNLFQLPSNISGVIIGNSHAACGFDDNYIEGFINFGASAEPYLYAYTKIQNLVEANKNLRTVILEFGHPHLNSEIVDEWLINERYIVSFEPYLSKDEWQTLFIKNPIGVLKNQPNFLSEYFDILKTPNFRFADSGKMGCNKRYENSTADSLLKKRPVINLPPADELKIHESNFEYLKRINTYCKENGIKLLLVRMPVLTRYRGWMHENKFQEIIQEQFTDINFIDLQNFPLQIEQFHDLDHLNISGSKAVSTFLNDAIKDGLLNQPNLQQYINIRMDLLNSPNAVGL